MSGFTDLISNQAFISFISTFGLAAALVLYFVIFRDPKQAQFWQKQYNELVEKYDKLSTTYEGLKNDAEGLWADQCNTMKDDYNFLSARYDDLSKTYERLQNDLRPQKRMISYEQAAKLAYIGLDRDLYKLFYYMCEKMAGNRAEDVNFFIEDSIRDSNDTWATFVSPFPKVPRIGDLYSMYANKGGSLAFELEDILKGDATDEEKRDLIWNKLVKSTVDMKHQFDQCVNTIKDGGEVAPYEAPEAQSPQDSVHEYDV